MTPETLAALHARCFVTPRPWTAAEFTDLLAASGCFLLTAPDGFVLGRTIADEAELLTIAVAPEARRHGIARALLARFAETARTGGAVTAFLEVAENNPAARALYAATGWQAAGRRRNYYRAPDGSAADALVLRIDLDAPEI